MPVEREEVPCFFNNDRFETFPEEGPLSAVFPVERLGIEAIDLPHPCGEIAPGRFEKEVIVIVQQAIGMAQPTEPEGRLREDLEEMFPVGGLKKDGLGGLALCLDIIDSSRILVPCLS